MVYNYVQIILPFLFNIKRLVVFFVELCYTFQFVSVLRKSSVLHFMHAHCSFIKIFENRISVPFYQGIIVKYVSPHRKGRAASDDESTEEEEPEVKSRSSKKTASVKQETSEEEEEDEDSDVCCIVLLMARIDLTDLTDLVIQMVNLWSPHYPRRQPDISYLYKSPISIRQLI